MTQNGAFPVYHKITGPIVIIGFGSIGRGTLPLIERHFDYDKSRLVVVEPALTETGREILAKHDVDVVEVYALLRGCPAGFDMIEILPVFKEGVEPGLGRITIGIGQPDDINPQLLSSAASSPSMYYYTPDPEDLAEIYGAIAQHLRCPTGRVPWGPPRP